MSRVRRQVRIIGPGATGLLRASYGLESEEIAIDVRVERVPRHLQVPNATFVALFEGRELVRVEASELWLEIQDKVRGVLNREWDPIGVSDVVDDEYDTYIEELYRLLKSHTSADAIAGHLLSIEVHRMGLRRSTDAKLLGVAARLCGLVLPDVHSPESAA